MWGSQETPKRESSGRRRRTKEVSPFTEAQGEDSVRSNQKSTQRFKVVQGGNPLRPPVA
ncbi:hypothetical protein AXF42_Ash000536 [Apostasia shenzhenica]|uniref:Uncharacterized protein n=1 Tax=Apostasia shenzhenica TaxID=1088818 RepID=A0A2I0A923_9ASPA|nr:hypothetical protein AXF42_Ash015446 [Apostasia shenzhenica]PKA52049.1 hypothetical protein AXF42_Ash013986 [Apostasia shenzhenica]PKA54701.1 hypothetical protein AXF42_Ash000536 [Apostasia shenzhenica]